MHVVKHMTSKEVVLHVFYIGLLPCCLNLEHKNHVDIQVSLHNVQVEVHKSIGLCRYVWIYWPKHNFSAQHLIMSPWSFAVELVSSKWTETGWGGCSSTNALPPSPTVPMHIVSPRPCQVPPWTLFISNVLVSYIRIYVDHYTQHKYGFESCSIKVTSTW